MSRIYFVLGIEGKMERLSTQTQESGFVSMHSQRSSSQSYTTASKRSSQQSSISYNSQSFSAQQQQSFSQTKLSSDSNGSIFAQKTSSKSTISTTNVSGNGDPALLEKLVNVGVTAFVTISFSCIFFFVWIFVHWTIQSLDLHSSFT